MLADAGSAASRSRKMLPKFLTAGEAHARIHAERRPDSAAQPLDKRRGRQDDEYGSKEAEGERMYAAETLSRYRAGWIPIVSSPGLAA